jgi:thiazolylpeptide-type bacteriocin precursor
MLAEKLHTKEIEEELHQLDTETFEVEDFIDLKQDAGGSCTSSSTSCASCTSCSSSCGSCSSCSSSCSSCCSCSSSSTCSCSCF